MIKVHVDDAALMSALARLSAAAHDLTPAMQAIAVELRSQTVENFQVQGRPKWDALKYPSKERRNGQILNDTDILKNSVQIDSGPSFARIGSDQPYAAIHQFGGKTKPHTIKPKHAKALKFNGGYAKSVQHPGSVIPARPFLPIDADGSLHPEAAAEVLDIVMEHLAKAAQG